MIFFILVINEIEGLVIFQFIIGRQFGDVDFDGLTDLLGIVLPTLQRRAQCGTGVVLFKGLQEGHHVASAEE
jgi:hypothetical protein